MRPRKGESRESYRARKRDYYAAHRIEMCAYQREYKRAKFGDAEAKKVCAEEYQSWKLLRKAWKEWYPKKVVVECRSLAEAELLEKEHEKETQSQ